MENNIDIFVFSHKTPKILPEHDVYKIVCTEEDVNKINVNSTKIICDKKGENIFNFERSYSEGSRIYYIWKNIPLKKYVGTAHYRRYFEFMENIPDLDEIFKTHDAILPKFELWDTVENQYKLNHNIKDLKIILDIIDKDYPEYSKNATHFIKGTNFIPCNIFILKKDMFNEYCKFVFDILNKYNKIMKFTCDLDVFNWVINHIDEYCDNRNGLLESVPYQARIQAFLMERLSNIFYNKHIKNPLMLDLVLTEVNFPEEKTIFKLYEK